MEDSLENWISQNLEMEEGDNIFNNQDHTNSSFNEQEFLREILQFEDSSQQIEIPHQDQFSTIQNKIGKGIVELGGATSPTNSTLSFDNETSFEGSGNNGTTKMHKCSSFNSIMSLEKCATNSPPTTPYLLSFDHDQHNGNSSKHNHDSYSDLRSKKRSTGELDGFENEPRVHQSTKVARGSSVPKTRDHIMAERKRRQEVTGCIIALSATIPGLKRMDKAYVLREAVNYMKILQERVKVLENQSKDHGRLESAKSTNNTDSNCRSIESQLEVEARSQENEVLIGIHCEKQNNILLKIHSLLGNLHLSITTSSVLPFGNSSLVITIVAQMEDKYRMTMDDLVKNLREDLLEAHDEICNSDPC